MADRTQINIRLTEEDRALCDAAARDAGLPLSSWLRMVARKAAKQQLRIVQKTYEGPLQRAHAEWKAEQAAALPDKEP